VSKFILSKAMGSIPDEMLQETMTINKNTGRKWIIRAAACLALVIGLLLTTMRGDNGVITGNGLLSLTVYATNADPFTISSTDTVVPFSHTWQNSVSWAPGWPITLSINSEHYQSNDIRFEVTVDGGVYYVGSDGGTSIYPGYSKPMPAQFSVPNNTTIFWSMWYTAEQSEHIQYEGEGAFTKIIVYDGDQIIGYTVLRFDRLTYGELNAEYYEQLGLPLGELASAYRLELLASVSFPKVDGQYQDVTLEYVNACMEKVCAN
jgi:hypothetical protein